MSINKENNHFKYEFFIVKKEIIIGIKVIMFDLSFITQYFISNK